MANPNIAPLSAQIKMIDPKTPTGFTPYGYLALSNQISQTNGIVSPNTAPTTTNQWLTGYNATTGDFTSAQPSFSNLAGTLAPSQIPDPTTTALGGVMAIAPVAHEWVNSISTAGKPVLSQPGFADLAGQINSTTQMPDSGVAAGSYTLANITVNVAGLVTDASNGVLSGTSGNLGGSAMTVGETVTTTVNVAGATTTQAAVTSPQTDPGSGFVWDAYVSAAGVVTVCLTCVAAGTPAATPYNVRVF